MCVYVIVAAIFQTHWLLLMDICAWTAKCMSLEMQKKFLEETSDYDDQN